MKGLQMMLKALGISLSTEQISQLEVLLPQLPSKVNEVLNYLQSWVKIYDTRLQAIEKNHQATLDAFKENNDNLVLVIEALRKEIRARRDTARTN